MWVYVYKHITYNMYMYIVFFFLRNNQTKEFATKCTLDDCAMEKRLPATPH